MSAFERASKRPGQIRDVARDGLLRALKLTEDTLVATSCSSAAARYLLTSDLSRLPSTPIGDGETARDVGVALRSTYYVSRIVCCCCCCFILNWQYVCMLLFFYRFRFDICRIEICAVDCIASSSRNFATTCTSDSSIDIVDAIRVARFVFEIVFFCVCVCLNVQTIIISFVSQELCVR